MLVTKPDSDACRQGQWMHRTSKGFEKYCSTCNIWRPPRAHHCSVCGYCMVMPPYCLHHCHGLLEILQRGSSTLCSPTATQIVPSIPLSLFFSLCSLSSKNLLCISASCLHRRSVNVVSERCALLDVIECDASGACSQSELLQSELLLARL